jgi:site-specific DNA-cytosine methylase
LQRGFVAGGQALGLEQAGFGHTALVEIEPVFCSTLRLNRPKWNVIGQDLNKFDGRPYQGVDLLAGRLPCPPFSVAGCHPPKICLPYPWFFRPARTAGAPPACRQAGIS